MPSKSTICCRCGVDRRIVERLWWECRTIPMTWAGHHHYDPVRRIRAGEKTHTLRGNPYKPGTILQVSASSESRQGKKRIPLWLRVAKCEPVGHEDIATDEFAMADGFRPPQNAGRTPAECMWDFMQEECPHREREEPGDWYVGLGPTPTGKYRDGYLIHFEVIRDEVIDD